MQLHILLAQRDGCCPFLYKKGRFQVKKGCGLKKRASFAAPAAQSMTTLFQLASPLLPLGVFYTACSLTVGASDVFIAFITEVPILNLGEVLYLRYRVFPVDCIT